MNIDPVLADLLRLVDQLEATHPGYLFMDSVHAAGADQATTDAAIADDLLLVDHRRRFDRATAEFHDVLVCRLNRQHPTVRSLLASD